MSLPSLICRKGISPNKNILLGKKVFGTLLFVLIVACSSESEKEDLGNHTIIKKKIQQFSELASSGYGGGVSSYSSGITSKSRSSDSTLFISQFPLAEYRRIHNIAYDSIIEYEIDTLSNDTISVNTSVIEVSKEFTGEVVVGDLWVPYEGYFTSQLYVGIPQSVLDTIQKIKMAANVTDSLAQEPAQGGISISLHNPDIDQSYYLFDNLLEIDSALYVKSDRIPVFDRIGELKGYSTGLILPRFRLYHQSDDVSVPITRTFTIEFKFGETTLSSVFSIKFVSEEEWFNRNCWLNQELECMDLYTE